MLRRSSVGRPSGSLPHLPDYPKAATTAVPCTSATPSLRMRARHHRIVATQFNVGSRDRTKRHTEVELVDFPHVQSASGSFTEESPAALFPTRLDRAFSESTLLAKLENGHSRHWGERYDRGTTLVRRMRMLRRRHSCANEPKGLPGRYRISRFKCNGLFCLGPIRATDGKRTEGAPDRHTSPSCTAQLHSRTHFPQN